MIRAQTAKVEEEMAYIKNYQLKFLNSDHAKFFLSHENNILGGGETVIAFKEQKPQIDAQALIPAEIKNSPWEEWKAYFSEKLP